MESEGAGPIGLSQKDSDPFKDEGETPEISSFYMHRARALERHSEKMAFLQARKKGFIRILLALRS